MAENQDLEQNQNVTENVNVPEAENQPENVNVAENVAETDNLTVVSYVTQNNEHIQQTENVVQIELASENEDLDQYLVDGSSCGAFMLKGIEYVMMGKEPNFNFVQQDILAFRKQAARDIFANSMEIE
ncbi:hypothetical protein LWI29_028764 [Acer saccharum]|uniref:Ubiquitin-like protease family profile domain-containing protein n=1 Tax=Acer saccharum TaxID=4024 RepID=A0AA39TXH6_ACESA|nr:hypothetical protein LWI29_028764 [Acer saccharum]